MVEPPRAWWWELELGIVHSTAHKEAERTRNESGARNSLKGHFL